MGIQARCRTQWAVHLPASFPPKTLDSPKDTRIIDLANGQRLKPHQAQSRITSGVAAGVYEHGKLVAIRRLTVMEMHEQRAHRRRLEEPLPAKEIEGVREVLPRSEVWTAKVRYDVLGAAREFYLHETAH